MSPESQPVELTPPAPSAAPPCRRRRWRLWLALLLMFGAGLLVGAVLTGVFLRYKMRQVIHGGPTVIQSHIVRHLSRELSLNAEQEQAAAMVVAEVQDEMRALRLRTQPQIEAIIDRGVERLRPSLDPSQQDALSALRVKSRRRWALHDQAYQRE